MNIQSTELPARFELNPGWIDIWYLPLITSPVTLDEGQRLLSADERARVTRFRSEEYRGLFVASRAVLRLILSRYARENPESLKFRSGINGKPSLSEHPEIRFNLAHSGNRAVYAVSAGEVGIDIEAIKPMPNWRKISRRFFSRREVEELEKLNPENQLAGFFSCWTRKEAYLKATGKGITIPLSGFYASPNPRDGKGSIEEEAKPVEWFFQDLELEEDYPAALVTRCNDIRVRMMRFSRVEELLRSMDSQQTSQII